ncbi:MAG: isoprenylcysteine carboxylmethyltransferase family protein [Pseudoxanthomonas sp.]
MIEIAPLAGKLFLALTAIWAASEIWLGLSRRSGDRARSKDSGTLRMLLVTIYVCIGIAVWLSSRAYGHFAGMRVPLFWIGLLLMATGMFLRFWSIRVLAHFFTVDVTIREGHELIRRGPYQLLRHPSYTGALMTFLGFGLALGNLASMLVVMVPVTIAFLWRIRIEEQVLANAFPSQYPEYVRQTRRLIPFVW